MLIVGLGNPGKEYEYSRHNTGRMILENIAKANDFSEWKNNPKLKSLVSKGEVSGEKFYFLLPETFMNNSGKSIATLVKSVKAAEKLVVIYDDFNLPLGRIRISFNRSSGGHNGVESIIKAVKTEAFLRIRVGTAAETAKGLAKVPHGEEKIEKFILGPFKDDEIKALKKVSKTIIEAIAVLIKEGKEKAMSVYNAG